MNQRAEALADHIQQLQTENERLRGAIRSLASQCRELEYPADLPDLDKGKGRGWFYQKNIASAWRQAGHHIARKLDAILAVAVVALLVGCAAPPECPHRGFIWQANRVFDHISPRGRQPVANLIAYPIEIAMSLTPTPAEEARATPCAIIGSELGARLSFPGYTPISSP